MRLQVNLCLLFVLISLICIYQTECSPWTGSTTPTPTRKPGWDFGNNYKDNDTFNPYDRKYNNDKDGYSGEKYDTGYNNDDDGNYDDGNYDDDYKPSESRSKRQRKSPDYVGNMNVYFREPSNDGKKRKPKRIRFSAARYSRERFPSFGPLVSFLPWVPIFADRLTKQTIIYSPTGGIFIIPPVINFYGQMYSVAELIASGYASLVSSGAPPPPAVDVAPLVRPGPVVGPSAPVINPATGGFKGGVRTKFQSFPRPDYPKVIEVAGSFDQQQDQPRKSYY